MNKKIIAVMILSTILVNGCGIIKTTDSTSDNDVNSMASDVVIVGDMEIAYDKNINNISYSNWADTGHETTIIYNSKVYDINAEHPNDQSIDFPCIYIDYMDTDTNEIKKIKGTYEALGRTEVNNKDIGNFNVIESKKRVFNDNQDIAYLFYDIIPKSDGYTYEITFLKGSDILADTEKSYNYKYRLDEAAYNSVSHAVDKYCNSKNVIGFFSGINNILDEMSGGLSEYKGNSKFKASEKQSEIQIIGKNGEIRGKEAEKLEDSDLPDITPEEEIIKQETLDITEVEEIDSIQSDISYILSPEDLLEKEKEFYVVGEDIEPGEYKIINNNKPRYNDNGELIKDSIIEGEMVVLQPHMSYDDPEDTEEDTVGTYAITYDDPEGYESINAVTLFNGQKIMISNINITLKYMGEFISEYTGDYN